MISLTFLATSKQHSHMFILNVGLWYKWEYVLHSNRRLWSAWIIRLNISRWHWEKCATDTFVAGELSISGCAFCQIFPCDESSLGCQHASFCCSFTDLLFHTLDCGCDTWTLGKLVINKLVIKSLHLAYLNYSNDLF